MKIELAGILVVLTAMLPAESRGAVLRVPEDYPSVLAGVDAAVAGDSVVVGPGTWSHREARTLSIGTYESALFLKPGVTVIGTAGAQATILDGGPQGAIYPLETVLHTISGTSLARIVGFTITGGGDGVGVLEAAPLELVECRLVGNSRRGVDAGYTTVTLTNCVVADNEHDTSPVLGAVYGISVVLTCQGTRFERNVGPAIRLSNAETSAHSLTLRDCIFLDNRARAALLEDTTVTIERCVFLRNYTSTFQGGAMALTGCWGSIRFCTFAFDTAAAGGGGLLLASSSVVAENNTFYACHSGSAGNALFVSIQDAGVRNNIFANCTGPGGAVRKTQGPMHPSTGCNLFWANANGSYFGDWQPAPTDVYADPQFCDPVALDLTLRSSSPAATNSGCGLIGSQGVTCAPVSVESRSWGSIKDLYR